MTINGEWSTRIIPHSTAKSNNKITGGAKNVRKENGYGEGKMVGAASADAGKGHGPTGEGPLHTGPAHEILNEERPGGC